MTLPTNIASTTVTGTFINLATGAPATGTVTFEPVPCRLVDASADVILLGTPVVAELDTEGHFEVILAATDDVDLNPVDWTYLVTVRLTDPARGWRFAMAAPADETVDLADVVPIEGSVGDAILVGPPGATGATGPAGPAGADGIGITDGDKGDIVVSASGATWMLDSAVVTAAAKTVLDDTTTTAMRTTLGLGNVDNTADTAKPVSTAQQTAIDLKADKATTISTTAPLTGGGSLAANRTLDISDFTTSTKGSVPSPGGTSTGRFLKDDGTWSLTPAAVSGASGVFPFTYNTSILESITGSQLRGNNSTFPNSTKLWISESTVDGLDVAVGLGRIKAGFQIYIQDYTTSSRYAIWNVTADSVDKGTYWEISVTPVSSAGTIPGGKVALQSLSSAAASNLFSTTSTAPGLAPGSNSAGASTWLSGAGTWTAPTKTTVGLSNVDNTSDATKDAATATLTNKTLTDPKINLAVNAQTGTTYTLVLTDASKLVTCSNAAAVTVTVPPNSSVAFPTGTQITIAGIGAGLVTVAQGAGVTVNATPSLVFRARYSAATLVKTGTDQWYLFGDLS